MSPGQGYARPASLAAALDARAAHPGWLVLAGGTDVMVPGARPTEPAGILDVFGLRDLHGVAVLDGTVHIGACTTFAELLTSDLVVDLLPLLHEAAREVGAVQIRERGTVGGNILTSSPVGDLLPGLLALDATVRVASRARDRAIPYEHFLTGYRQVDLAPDELLVAVQIPVPRPGVVQHWRKVATRAAQAVTKVSLAAAARVTGGRAHDVRLAFGGVADRPVRVPSAEVLVEGGPLTAELAAQVEAAVAEALHPITDSRSTADYRRDVAARLAARFTASLLDGRR